jgi:hypothetical protein
MDPMKMTIRILGDQSKIKNIDCDRDYQRGLVWSLKDKREYIKSLVNIIKDGLELPSTMSFNKINYVYHCIDGKQRITAILEFIDCLFGYHDIENGLTIFYDKVPLSYKKKENHNYDGVSMSPHDRELFNDHTIKTTIYKNLPYSGEVNFFMLINYGVPLTISETLMGYIKNEDIANSIKDIASSYQSKLSKYNCSERGKNIRFVLKLIFFCTYKNKLENIDNIEQNLKKYEAKNVENKNDNTLKKMIKERHNLLGTFLVQDLLLNDSIKINIKNNLKENSLVILLEKLRNSGVIPPNNGEDKNLFITKVNEYYSSIRDLNPNSNYSDKIAKIAKFADELVNSLKNILKLKD